MPPKKKEETGELMISIEKFTETREAVIVSLNTLQAGLSNVNNLINTLISAYLKHTSSVIQGHNGHIEELKMSPAVTATVGAAVEAAATAASGLQAAIAVDGKGVKKRKRIVKEKDPNAPKKPLTAAFLYHQHARPIVKADLEAALGPGEKVEKSAVQTEMNKRWHELPEEEKDQWKASYRKSLAEWNVQMQEYKAKNGQSAADIHEDEDGSDDAEAEVEVEAGAADTEASSDEDEEIPPVAKAPSPAAKPGRKRQKTAHPSVNGTSDSTPTVPGSTSTPVPLPGSRAAPQAAATAPETSAKKTTKKKAAPQPIAPAPAAVNQHEASPEEQGGKKKAKGGRTTRNAPEAEVDKENTAAATPVKKRDRSKRKSEATA